MGHLRTLGITEIRETNQIANYALLEWGDNGEITDRAPADYFPEYIARVPESGRGEMRRYHALPDNWEQLPYRGFLEQRRSLIAAITIHEGFERISAMGSADLEEPVELAAARIEEAPRIRFRARRRPPTLNRGSDRRRSELP